MVGLGVGLGISEPSTVCDPGRVFVGLTVGWLEKAPSEFCGLLCCSAAKFLRTLIQISFTFGSFHLGEVSFHLELSYPKKGPNNKNHQGQTAGNSALTSHVADRSPVDAPFRWGGTKTKNSRPNWKPFGGVVIRLTTSMRLVGLSTMIYGVSAPSQVFFLNF